MKISRQIARGLAGAVLLATTDAAAAGPTFHTQVLPGMATLLSPCDPQHPTTPPTEKWVIRIGIRENMNILNPGRHVHFEHNKFNDDGANEDGGKANKPSKTADPFHVNINTIDDAIPQGDYAMVRVVLHDKNGADWAQWDGQIQPNGKPLKIIGIGVGDNPKQMLCGPLSFDKTKGKPVAVFFLKLNQKPAGPKPETPNDDIATFTIGFSPASGSETPIFVDPKVRNPG